ncbi:MAG: pilus assembly protein, partial [Marinicaulis sp.]|nr:pilus assembly protein [Marinicaulis sp.]
MSDTHGNIAMMFILMSSLLFLFVGGSVDYARYNSVRADMLASLDAASLAIARMEELHPNMTDPQLITYGEKFFAENAQKEGLILKPSKTPYSTISEIVAFDLTSDTTKVKACIDGTIKTALLSVVNIDYLDVKQCVGITKFGAGRIELALVLDVTGSMNWNDNNGVKKITSLKNAVTAMLDVMFDTETQSDNLKVGVIPFNTHVNAGGSSAWQNSWGDLNADSFYHGARFIHVDENGDVDMNTKVNHYNLFASDPDRSWEGCVESRPYPLDELDTPPGSASSTSFLSTAMASLSSSEEPDATTRNAQNNMPNIDPGLSLSSLASSSNSRFVPVFLGDEPDCNANWNGRCPSWNGNSYWEDTETFLIGGSNYSQSFWRSWFVDPDSNSGISESNYINSRYIDDEDYIGINAGEPAGRYAKVVEFFRSIGEDAGSLTSEQTALKDFMENLGVNDFYDSDITSAGDGSYANSDEYILRNSYVGWWNPATQQYDHKFDLPKDSSSDGPNPQDCPQPILAMTDTRADIDGGDGSGGIMANLTATGYTNIAAGAVWGWRVVSDGLPFTESTGPGDTGPGGTDETNWQRAVVIMTDGEMNFSDRST